MLLAGALALGLGGCLGHHGFAMLPLPSDEGWFTLPTARWLLDAPVDAQTLALCPREACAEQAFVAQFRLTGPSRALVAQLGDDPKRFAASLQPTPRRGRNRASPPPRVTAPLSIGRWRGAILALESRKDAARAAHVAVLGRANTGEILLAVAESAATAERLARQALE